MLAVTKTASDDQTGEKDWGIGDAFQKKTGTGAWTADADGRTLQADRPRRTGVLNFTAPANTRLDADTSYLVVMTPSSDSGFTWVGTTSDDQDSGAASGWSIANAYRLSLAGAWDADTSGRSFRIAIKGTEITNSNPEFPAETAALTVAENTYRGNLGGIVDTNTISGNVGDAVSASDSDRDALAYSVAATSDSDAAAHLTAFNQDFALDAKTGQVSIKVGALIDYEDRTSYKVKVQVSDGRDGFDRADATIDDTTTLTITVTDVANEKPHTTRPPQVGSAGSDCVWTPGEKVVITLNFNEAVTVDTSDGTPSLTFEWHFQYARSAEYESGSGTRDLKFAYTFPAGDPTYQTMRVMSDTLVLNGGTITGAGGVAADLRMGPASGGPGSGSKKVRCAPWPDTSKPRPTITGVEVTGAWGPATGKAGTWSAGRTGHGSRNVDVWLTFSEPVNVFTGEYEVYGLPSDIRSKIARPTVKIKTEFGDKTATWVVWDVGTNRLLFRYKPTTDDGFIRAVEVVANSLVLNDTRIRSVASGQPAVITHDGEGSVTQPALLVENQSNTRAALVSNSDEENAAEWAQSFTTGNEAVTLDGIRVRGTFTNQVTILVFDSDNEGNSRAQQGALDPPGGFTNLPRSGNFYFRSNPGLQLAANATYWVSIIEFEAGKVALEETTTNDETGTTGWTIGDSYRHGVEGGSFQTDNDSLMFALYAKPAGAAGTSGASGASGSQGSPGDEEPAEEEVEPFTAALEGLPASHDGSSAFTFTLRFSREPDELSYRDIEAGLVYVRGAALSRVRRATPGSNQAWALTVTPNQNGDVVIRVLPRSCDERLKFCADGRPLAESLHETVPGPDTANNEATGGPTVTGTPQVGQTLTASTSGITDADGLTNATFAYQWVRQDQSTAESTEIADATGSTYTVADADVGHVLMVVVTFTDDAGNEEELSSLPLEVTETQQSGPRGSDDSSANSPATGEPTISGTAQVGRTLTADTSGIADDDGLTKATYTYQWLADDTDISGATGSTHTLTTAEQGKAITVRVSFTDDAGNEESLTSAATAAVAAQQAPPAPTNLAATVNSDGHVVLTWTAPDDDSVTGYQVLRRRPSEGENSLQVYVADTGSTSTTYTDTNVTAGTQHVYRVKAINAAGTSGQSNYVNVTPQAPQGQQAPPAPTNLAATVNSDGHVVLSWTAPNDDSVTGYVILRRRPSEGENSLQVYVADTGSTATTYTDTEVTAGTQHVYRVRAINSAGQSGRSNYVNVTP